MAKTLSKICSNISNCPQSRVFYPSLSKNTIKYLMYFTVHTCVTMLHLTPFTCCSCQKKKLLKIRSQFCQEIYQCDTCDMVLDIAWNACVTLVFMRIRIFIIAFTSDRDLENRYLQYYTDDSQIANMYLCIVSYLLDSLVNLIIDLFSTLNGTFC